MAAVLDSYSVKTTERGGTWSDNAGRRVKGRKRQDLVDTRTATLACAIGRPSTLRIGTRPV